MHCGLYSELDPYAERSFARRLYVYTNLYSKTVLRPKKGIFLSVMPIRDSTADRSGSEQRRRSYVDSVLVGLVDCSCSLRTNILTLRKTRL